MKRILFCRRSTFLFSISIMVVSVLFLQCRDSNAERGLLSGQVLSLDGEPLPGIPIRTRLANKNMTMTVFTNREGHYSYRDLLPGVHSVSIRAVGFEPVEREGVSITQGKSEQLDFTLKSVSPTISDLTTYEVVTALPGTEKQKAEAAGCSDCHSLQFVLQQPRRSREGWLRTIERMRGVLPNGTTKSEETLKAILKQTETANNQLAELLVSVRGPDSPDIPYNRLDLPANDAYSRALITEYHIPRGARTVILRGDINGAWTHDLLLDSERGYVWYTDHFSNVLGRLDPENGDLKEFSYPDTRPGRGGGGHKLVFGREGNIWIGAIWQGTVVKFDPREEQFEQWMMEDFESDGRLPMVEMDLDGIVWASSTSGNIYKINPQSGATTKYVNPNGKRRIYGMGIDSKGVLLFCHMSVGKVGRFDPRTEKFTEWSTSSPNSFPRRLDIDDQDRLWFAEFEGGKLGMLDPQTGTVREWALADRPYVAPYDVAIDRKNKMVWTTDFNSDRIFRFDMNTEQVTEFLMPEPDVEIRDIMVDSSTTPTTVWIPDYRPPGKLLKLQAW